MFNNSVSAVLTVLRSAAASTLDLVFPRSCEGCGGSVDQPGYICWNCLCSMEKIHRPYCELCGDPVDGRLDVEYMCSWCSKAHRGFDQARSLFRYRGPAVKLVQCLKYGNGMYLADGMAELMAAVIDSLWGGVRFDVVAGVPMHSRKERSRSYNQAALVATALSRRTGIEAFNRVLKRTGDKGSQTVLKAAQRARNVKGSFEVADKAWICGRNVLLVDDVMTTGATAGEVGSVLKEAGAASVRVLTFARG